MRVLDRRDIFSISGTSSIMEKMSLREGSVISWNIVPFMDHWLMVVESHDNIDDCVVIHYGMNMSNTYKIETLREAWDRSHKGDITIHNIHDDVISFEWPNNIIMNAADEYVKISGFHLLTHNCQTFVNEIRSSIGYDRLQLQGWWMGLR